MIKSKINYQLRFWQIATGLLTVSLLSVIMFGLGFGLGQNSGSGQLSPAANLDIQTVLGEILPTGIPAVYGAELGVSYDDITSANPQLANQTIDTLSYLDRTLELSGVDLERYIDLLYFKHGGLSCEFCCGAPSIIFETGQAACACEHSFAMRGLAKYLILEHGDTLSDEEIMAEIGKWKILFFPEIHAQKTVAMAEAGLAVDYISLTSNANRGLETKSAGGGMIGDC